MAIYTRTLQMKTTRKVYSDLFSFETGATALGPFSTFVSSHLLNLIPLVMLMLYNLISF